MSLLGKFSMEVAKRGERGGSASILFKGWMSVFVNRNDADEPDILVDNQRNQQNLRA